MTKKQRLNCYKKLEKLSNCLTNAGKDRLWHMTHTQHIHEFDAIMIILEQHADLVDPAKKPALISILHGGA